MQLRIKLVFSKYLRSNQPLVIPEPLGFSTDTFVLANLYIIPHFDFITLLFYYLYELYVFCLPGVAGTLLFSCKLLVCNVLLKV